MEGAMLVTSKQIAFLRSYREREEVEDFCTVPPSICISILPLTLIKKAIYLHALNKPCQHSLQLGKRGYDLADCFFGMNSIHNTCVINDKITRMVVQIADASQLEVS